MPESLAASAVSPVAMWVRNLDQSLRFSRDRLGFPVPQEEQQDTSTGGLPHVQHARHARRRVVPLRYGARHSVPFLGLTAHPGETVSGAPIMLDQGGNRHIACTVPNIEALPQRLRAAGAQTCGPAEACRAASGRLRPVLCRDPDGILVQFDEDGEGETRGSERQRGKPWIRR